MIQFYALNHATGKEIKGFFMWQSSLGDKSVGAVLYHPALRADFEQGRIGDQILDIVGDAASNPENERGFFEIENEHEHWDGQWTHFYKNPLV